MYWHYVLGDSELIGGPRLKGGGSECVLPLTSRWQRVAGCFGCTLACTPCTHLPGLYKVCTAGGAPVCSTARTGSTYLPESTLQGTCRRPGGGGVGGGGSECVLSAASGWLCTCVSGVHLPVHPARTFIHKETSCMQYCTYWQYVLA
jgi:hypothetical protein